MRRITIHCFNMVEIILAVGVVAIAIGSIMGLLPVALKANRDAIAENCMASASDIARTYIESLYLGDGSFGSLDSTLPDAAPSDPADKTASSKTNILGNEAAKFYRLSQGTYRLDFVSNSDTTGASNSDRVDFSALVKIWRQGFADSEVLYVPRRDTAGLVGTSSASGAMPTSGTNQAIFKGSNVPGSSLQNVMVEISYPIDASEENRNTMTFSIPYAAKEQ